jgi:hypothetical protein
MHDLPAEDSRRARRAWLAGAALGGVYFANELLFTLPGPGSGVAITYVTLRGWMLPLVSMGFGLHVLLQSALARTWAGRALVLAAVTIPTAVVALCWFYQWPLFS